MPELTQLPTPTWYGAPEDAEEQFLQFARRHHEHYGIIRQYDSAQEIGRVMAERNYRGQTIRELRSSIQQYKERIATLTSSLIDTANPTRFADELQKLAEHPSLLGLRPDSWGRLILHLRVFRDASKDSEYIGDFELALHPSKTRYDGEWLPIVQTDVAHYGQGFQTVGAFEDAISGKLYNYRALFHSFLERSALVELVELILDQLRQGSKSKKELGLPVAPFEPTWQGIAPNMERAFARSLDWAINDPAKAEILEIQQKIETNTRTANEEAALIRDCNRKLSRLKAAQAELNQTPALDEEAVRRDFVYIMTLPGVMGIRFEADVPIVHVRSSIMLNGIRYDAGDYEVSLREQLPGGADVVSVHQTRKTKQRWIYYHHQGPHTRYSWFCFGNRSAELRRFFRRGEFGGFLHLLINSLNSVNDEDKQSLPLSHYFNEIAMDAPVWSPPVDSLLRRVEQTGKRWFHAWR